VTGFSVAIRALRNGRWDEIRDVGEAQLELLRAQAMRWVRPLGEFVEVSADGAATQPPAIPSSVQAEICERITAAVTRATRYGVFRPLCLTRAVAISRMLDARGVVGHRIRIGVRREGGSFNAHAWVELGNLILGDTAKNTLEYLPLTQVSVAGEPVSSGIAQQQAHSGARYTGDRLRWDQ
jgi:hypothetical protein